LKRLVLLVMVLLFSTTLAFAQEAGSGAEAGESAPATSVAAPAKPRPWWVGGAIGLNFGEYVNYIEFSPQLAYRILPRFQLGASLIYRYKKDKRFDPDLSTTDYGASLFGRYFFFDPIFAQVEVERRLWEYPLIVDDEGNYEKIETDYTGYYAGLGFAIHTSPYSAMFMTLLYDFNYDGSLPMPHSHPWIFRIGYGATF